MKIEFKNVNKSFKKVEILKNINLKFTSGNIYGIYGRNGSGKSVFLKMIAGFLIPTSGEILFDNENLNLKQEFPKNLRALIENPSFFPDLSGFDNLKLLSKIQNKITDKEILNALDIVNLIEEKDKKYSKYSLGMKQKLGIAQAIMEDPKILILDEPFNGIEEKTVKKLIKYLKEIKKDKIIFISTHIKEDLLNLSDKTLYFDNKEIKERDLYENTI
jgi:ABC-2 type transport system ATP-binding protein